jgi:hypothetical protein
VPIFAIDCRFKIHKIGDSAEIRPNKKRDFAEIGLKKMWDFAEIPFTPLTAPP